MKKLGIKFGNMKTTAYLIVLCMLMVFSSCDQQNVLQDEVDPQNVSESDPAASDLSFTYNVAGTGQINFYNNQSEILAPELGDSFYGQDASYIKNQPSYTDNGDGTITDNITGLIWQKDPGNKMTYQEAAEGVSSFNLAGYNDWRLPTIKELYSLVLFKGEDPSGYNGNSTAGLVPFIDTDYFDFEYGDPSAGERFIDSQFATSTLDVGDSEFGGGNLMFGVNFADGRIKGYPTRAMPGQSQGKTFFVLYVRGNENYGVNNFVDNGDGTITDNATGLMWMQDDSGSGMVWKDALKFAEEMDFAGYTDWRLPDCKELQSIVEYNRAPGATNSAAIDPVFNCTSIINEAGQVDFPYFWSSTTHSNFQNGGNAAYLSFGRAMGYFNNEWQDVHGAGAQRSDPKIGDSGEYPAGHGPQGDAIRIYNYVRCVRNINSAE